MAAWRHWQKKQRHSLIHSYPFIIITMTERTMYSERLAEYNKQQNAQRMIKNVDTLVYTTYAHIKNMLRIGGAR